MFDSRSTKSVPKHTSRAQLAETKRRNKGPRSQPSLDPAKTETSSSRMTKRLRQLAEDELVDNLERYDNQDQAKTPDRSTAQDNPRKGEIQPIKSFARPKPPGKNRAALVSQPSLLNKSRKSPLQGQDSRGTEQNTSTPLAGSQAEPETGLVSASLESRMDHVRDWLKERNPPMISPPLSLRSDDLRESRMPHKRKAYRQLAPPTGSKRLAMEGSRDRQRRDEDSRIYPQLSDTVASASQTQSQPLSRKSNALLSPRHDRQRTVIGTSKEIDPLRDQAEADLSPPPINWSKFQRPKTVARTSSSSSATAVAFPSSSFTFRKTPTKSNSFIAKALDAEDEDNPTVSPLIKLRQSQLKQRQHEDYLGIKRDDAMNRRAEAEGALAFNQALETWEREDDEALARNAAREAAEAEARGQRPGISQDDSPSSLSSDPEEKRRRTSPSLMDKEYSSSTNSAPARSLLRAVPFNGESSRRPVPDFQSKRSLSDTPTQQRTVSDPGADAAPSSIPSRRPASPLDQRPLSTKSFSSSFDNGNSHTRGSASLTKRISYSNTRKEDTANRRERHPGLYTPSKKKPIPDAVSILNKQPHTPTVMSRYIQLSNLSDEEELYE
ncbi:hypothetical protein BGX27_005913 [Mortierella sp. AM989]|nr:hypothetical protein BGX27_005913 [Mortierella sp. AM989]